MERLSAKILRKATKIGNKRNCGNVWNTTSGNQNTISNKLINLSHLTNTTLCGMSHEKMRKKLKRKSISKM